MHAGVLGLKNTSKYVHNAGVICGVLSELLETFTHIDLQTRRGRILDTCIIFICSYVFNVV